MRARKTGVLLLSVLAGGCQSPANPPPSPAPSGGSLARCGGMDSPAGFEIVVAGTDNQYFTARTRQSLEIKPDAEVKTKLDEKGSVVGLTVIARDGSVDISCACPGGCRSDPGPVHGCVIQYPPGGGPATCSGDCVTDNGCCFGCGWMAPR